MTTAPDAPDAPGPDAPDPDGGVNRPRPPDAPDLAPDDLPDPGPATGPLPLAPSDPATRPETD